MSTNLPKFSLGGYQVEPKKKGFPCLIDRPLMCGRRTNQNPHQQRKPQTKNQKPNSTRLKSASKTHLAHDPCPSGAPSKWIPPNGKSAKWELGLPQMDRAKGASVCTMGDLPKCWPRCHNVPNATFLLPQNNSSE